MGALRGGIITRRPLCLAQDAKHFFAPCGNDIRVYSTVSGDHVATLRGHEAEVTAVSLDPSSAKQVYSAAADGMLKLWDYQAGTCLRTYNVQEPVEGLVVSPALNLAYLSLRHRQGGAGRVAAFQLPSGELLPGRLKTRTPPRLFISPSGSYVGSIERASLLVWQAGSDLSAKPLNFTHTRPYTCAAIDPTDNVLAAGDASGRILLWHGLSAALRSGQPPACSTVHWHAHAVGALAFSSDGLFLLSGGLEGVLVQWQLSGPKRTYLPRLGGPLCGIQAAGAQPGRYLVAQSDNSVRLVNMAAMRVECSVHGLRPPPQLPPSLEHGWGNGWGGAALQPGTGYLVLAGTNASLQFFDAARDVHAGRMQVAPRNMVSVTDASQRSGIYGPPAEPQVVALAFGARGDCMATVDVRPDGGAAGSVEPCLRFWDRPPGGAQAGAPPYALNTRVDGPHRGLVTGLAFHPTADMAATCSDDGEYKIWVRGRAPGGSGASSSSAGAAAAAGAGSCWRCAGVGSYKQQQLGSCAFSHDGSLLAVAAGGCVTPWRPATNSLVRVLTQPPGAGGGPIGRLAFLAGSPTLVATTEGELPQLIAWDLLTAATKWVLSLPSCALAADPAAPRFAVGVPAGAAGANAPGGVLVFGPHALEPLHACAVPHGGSPAALLYVPAGAPLAAATGSTSSSNGSGADASPLLLVTSDRRFALLSPPGSAADAGAAAGSTGVGAAAAGEQPAGGSLLDAAFGRAHPAKRFAEPAPLGPVAAGEVAKRAAAQLFDAPSHVLPPPSALMPTLLQLLVSAPQQE